MKTVLMLWSESLGVNPGERSVGSLSSTMTRRPVKGASRGCQARLFAARRRTSPGLDRDHARDAAKAFDNEFRAKWPKAADKIRDDLDQLLTCYDFPAEHWIHLKTSNPIESTFATVRLLIEAAEDRWRAINGPMLVALVRAGATFRNGVLVESKVQEEEVAA